jgi:hypothetical protein
MASSTTTSRNNCACGGFIVGMNNRVAARQPCGDHFSGWVRASMRDHAGREGMTLKTFGSGPERYFWRRNPTLCDIWSVEITKAKEGDELGISFDYFRIKPLGRIWVFTVCNDANQMTSAWLEKHRPRRDFRWTTSASPPSNFENIRSARVLRSPEFAGKKVSSVFRSPESSC